ncbi:MAG: hypothetical protein JXB47_19325 [Anaerolineae bacterium]|nr:hypothetical protein [Anaerolineae bacterium]
MIDVAPDKAYYRPGETVTLYVTATGSAAARIEATIVHLTETLAVLGADLAGGAARLSWTPPAAAPRGYGAEVRLLGADGAALATASTAFDVLEHWIQAPRYGFLSEFAPDRADIEETMAWAARYHINGLQFYDWQYRHEALLPPEDPYTDLLGRRLSLQTVTRLIGAAHARHIAAMPYTAIYGASAAFYAQHPDWALFEWPDHPYKFGDDFLYIMDPTPGSPWAGHLLGEFGRVLEETAFDGIHLDQYGAPKVGRNAAGERIDLAEVFPAFIDRAAEVVHRHRGDDGAMIFNAVGNWPVETVAPAGQDAVYIEVWEPYSYFLDFHRLVAEAQQLGGGKPVIIAAYIHPDQTPNVRLADALIFASGGYHLELGEPGAMLTDPYFPKFGQMDSATQTLMKRYYDFQVRYEEVLALDTSDAAARAADLILDGIETGGRRSRDRVVVVARAGDGFETFSLVNLMGLENGRWQTALPAGPAPLDDLTVRIRAEKPVKRIWWASPDGDDLGVHPLSFTADGDQISFVLPRLEYWDMIVLEYSP